MPQISYSYRLLRGSAAGALAASALALMVMIPVVESAARVFMGRGVDNAAVLVQHLGLLMAMAGAVAAAQRNELNTLFRGSDPAEHPGSRPIDHIQRSALIAAAVIVALMARVSWEFVRTEIEAGTRLAYSAPVWAVQLCLPIGFAMLALKIASGAVAGKRTSRLVPLLCLAIGWFSASGLEMLAAHAFWLAIAIVVVALVTGAPIFACLGALALVLVASEALPLTSVPLSQYQITVNPSIPALPMFTLAGLVIARTGAATRICDLLRALFGSGPRAVALAAALLCSAFTALSGGSGVTILALGGLLLPMLTQAGYPERRAIGLLTGASALGVLIAPSIPLILYAVIARVPIDDMFKAGLMPAAVMVGCLLLFGGHLRRQPAETGLENERSADGVSPRGWTWRLASVRAATWELVIPVVAIGSIASGLATPTESAALTAAYVISSQALIHRNLSMQCLANCLVDSARLIGSVILILGMALALTNYLTDVGAAIALVDLARAYLENRYVFLIALLLVLFAAAAVLEIYAAIVVLIPLLLPLATSYGIDPVQFGVIFLAAMEVGFICPPAGMNLYFASAMFGKPLSWIWRATVPSLLAIMVGTAVVALLFEIQRLHIPR